MCAMDNFIWIYLHIHGECAIIKAHRKAQKAHKQETHAVQKMGRNRQKLRNGGRGKS